MKPRLLFLDDEEQILDGLRMRLRQQRKVWKMSFVENGPAALELLAADPYDVVISDMRMPVMDGVAFLEQVRRHHPDTARVVLSGHADQDLVLRSVPSAHQFLTKPCEHGVLERCLERILAARATLPDPVMRGFVTEMGGLPPRPGNFRDLVEILEGTEVNESDVSAVIRKDSAMSAKLLQVVNSGFVTLARSTGGIEEAVSRLGLENIRAIAQQAVSAQVLNRFDHSEEATAQQRHALAVGEVSARCFANPVHRDEAFTAGLLHDVGRIPLAEAPEPYRSAHRSADTSQPRPRHLNEQERLGFDHAAVGGYLLELWGLPGTVVEAATAHHAPDIGQGSRLDLKTAVHLADALVHEVEDDGSGIVVDRELVARLGRAESLPDWFERTRKVLARLEPAECVGSAR